MGIPAPLPDTERIVEWDELPERVRQIPANFDPLAEGVLMKHQVAWISMQQGLDIAVCEKGRRTGITFAQALDDTITAATEKDAGGDENYHVVTVDRTGGDARDLTPGEKVKANVVDILEDDDDHLILSHNRRDESVFDVFRVDLATGAETLIAQNPGNVISWGTDHEGKLRVAGTSDGVNTSLLYRESEDDEFVPIVTTSFKETVTPLFFTFDNRRLYVASNRGRDKSAIFEFDPATAKEGALPLDLVQHQIARSDTDAVVRLRILETKDDARSDRAFPADQLQPRRRFAVLDDTSVIHQRRELVLVSGLQRPDEGQLLRRV